jgi:hypothetical protein
VTIQPPNQLRTYTTLRTLQSRAEALEQNIAQLQRACLHGRAVPEVVATMSELRWQLRKLDELTGLLEATFGTAAAAAPVVRGKGDALRTPGAAKPDAKPEAKTGAKAEPPEGNEPGGVRGTIETLGVPDLVGMISSLQKTGTLTLQGDGAMFVFEFEAGRVVHAITNKHDPAMRLGTILVAQNHLTEQQLRDSLAAATAGKQLLGDVLVRSATVSEEDLRTALDEQVRRIFEAAFSLRLGRFAFQEGSLSTLQQRTSLNTMHLLLEAARMRDENGDGIAAGTSGTLLDRC